MIIRGFEDIFVYWGIPVILLVTSYFLLRKKKVLFLALLLVYIGLNVYHFATYVPPHPSDKYNIVNRFGLFFKLQAEAFFLFLFALIYWFIQKLNKRKKEMKIDSESDNHH